jgi:hypothetical protein
MSRPQTKEALTRMASQFTSYGDLGAAVGLTNNQIGSIMVMNDYGRSFAELADEIESWFPERALTEQLGESPRLR